MHQCINILSLHGLHSRRGGCERMKQLVYVISV